MKKAVCILLLFCLLTDSPASATDSPEEASSLCIDAAIRGARISGVPPEVLHAISLVETGRSVNGQVRPWPWAVNRAGDGRWFKDRREAMKFAEATLEEGRTNVDIGCFQMNYHWHGRRFDDLDEMFDPVAGAVQAGAFLRSLYAQSGDWSKAAGTYHSSTPERAQVYRERFDRALANLRADPSSQMPLVVRGAASKKRSRVKLAGRPLVITIEQDEFAPAAGGRGFSVKRRESKAPQKQISSGP
ncbi:lytic transglycosylase domain-containing protein [Amaricoccus macauensis]|uniref:lytic transglycosylase domain-containing protein n=1 Tax=Amaricoccus macauensis TaxID=57001 RepID=UPI003C7A0474